MCLTIQTRSRIKIPANTIHIVLIRSWFIFSHFLCIVFYSTEKKTAWVGRAKYSFVHFVDDNWNAFSVNYSFILSLQRLQWLIVFFFLCRYVSLCLSLICKKCVCTKFTENPKRKNTTQTDSNQLNWRDENKNSSYNLWSHSNWQ